VIARAHRAENGIIAGKLLAANHSDALSSVVLSESGRKVSDKEGLAHGMLHSPFLSAKVITSL
jgi:hypothetical protein